MKSRTRFLAALFLAQTAVTGTAQAYEVMKLKGDGERIGVIVLAYNDDWASYLGEWLFDVYLHHLMGKRYESLYVARGKGLSVEEVQQALRDALATGRDIDFMTSTHSDEVTITLSEGVEVRPDELIAPVLDEESATRLDVAGNFGCNSAPQWDQFSTLGFRSYVGHEGISVGAVAMRSFLRHWLKKCRPMDEAVERTNTGLNKLFKNSALARWIFRLLSPEDEYTAVMTLSGASQDICR